MEPVVFPVAEALLVSALSPLVGVPVSAEVPNPRPETFVRVERVGGTRRDVVTDLPMVVVECWAPTKEDAASLARATHAHVHALAQTEVDGSWIRAVADVGGPQSFPDPTSRSPRYQFTVQMQTRGVAL